MPTTTSSTSAVRRRADDRRARRGVAVAASVGFAVVSTFQIALMLGAPFGAAAFGGGNAGQLPTGLRIASAISAVVWLLAALIVLARGGFAVSPLPRAVSRWGTWALVGLLGLGALMNFASASPWERFGWGPVALTLAVLCLILARGGVEAPEPSGRCRTE